MAHSAPFAKNAPFDVDKLALDLSNDTGEADRCWSGQVFPVWLFALRHFGLPPLRGALALLVTSVGPTALRLGPLTNDTHRFC